MAPEARASDHVLRELGFTVSPAGDELRGTAAIRRELWVPGTEVLRTSVLATWTDTVAGLLAVGELAPGVPVTLELDVHVYEPHLGEGRVDAVGRVVKSGRSVVVAGVDFTDAGGAPVATGMATFMAAPDPALRMPPGRAHLDAVAQTGPPLAVPLAERARCERVAPGVATLPRGDDGLNASGTVNGGLLALAAEEAVLSAAPGVVLASMAMRYLRPVRVGPAVATATLHADVARAEVVDEGRGGAPAAVVTARCAPAPGPTFS